MDQQNLALMLSPLSDDRYSHEVSTLNMASWVDTTLVHCLRRPGLRHSCWHQQQKPDGHLGLQYRISAITPCYWLDIPVPNRPPYHFHYAIIRLFNIHNTTRLKSLLSSSAKLYTRGEHPDLLFCGSGIDSRLSNDAA